MVEVTKDFDKSTNQVADLILILLTKMRQIPDDANNQFSICKIVTVNDSAMTWDLTVRALDAEALQTYCSLLLEVSTTTLGFYFKWEGMSRL